MKFVKTLTNVLQLLIGAYTVNNVNTAYHNRFLSSALLTTL